MPDEILELLKRARARLAPAGAWTQKAAARNAAGEEVAPNDPAAVQFCPVGAVQAEMAGDTYPKDSPVKMAIALLNRAAPQPRRFTMLHWVAAWNNQPSRRQVHVLALLDRVIRELEQQP